MNNHKISCSEIKKILDSIIQQLTKDLQNHPYFLINEHDLQAYLYFKFSNENFFNKFVMDDKKEENYLIHCQYSRRRYRSGKNKLYGWWDIVILKEQQNNELYWTDKPVSIGAELKLCIDRFDFEIIPDINSESTAIGSRGGSNKYADWGLLFYINVGKKAHDNMFNKIKEHIINLQMNNQKTFYVYIEAYADKSEPNTILSCPLS